MKKIAFNAVVSIISYTLVFFSEVFKSKLFTLHQTLASKHPACLVGSKQMAFYSKSENRLLMA